MSIATNTVFPMKVIKVVEPRCDVGWNDEYFVCQGGQLITWKRETSQTYSNSILSWTPTTPSRAVLVMKVFYMDLEPLVTLTSVTATKTNFQAEVIENASIGLRSYPFQSMCSSSTLTIGGCGVSQLQVNAILDPLNQYVADVGELFQFETHCPTMPDQFQQYVPQGLPNPKSRNPLVAYGDTSNGGYMESRSIANYLAAPIAGAGGDLINGVQLALKFSEPVLYLSPLVNGMRQGPGSSLYGINTFSLSFTISAPNRILSAGVNSVDANKNITGKFTGWNNIPNLEVCYITPQANSVPPLPHGSGNALNWNYLNYDYQESVASAAIAYGASVDINCNSYTAKSVPKYLCIFARVPYGTTTIGQPAFDSNNYVDAYALITKLNISWNNNNQRLGEMNADSLYELSNKNKTKVSYPRYNGTPDSILAAVAPSYTGSGGALLIDCAQDLGLTEDLAPGVVGNYQVTITATVKNISTATTTLSLAYVVVYAGVFQYNKMDGTFYSQVGVLSDQLINPALPVAAHGSHEYITSFSGGAKFFDKFKSLINCPIMRHAMRRDDGMMRTMAGPGLGGRRRKSRKGHGRKRKSKRFGGAKYSDSEATSGGDMCYGGRIMSRADLLTDVSSD